MNRICWVSGVGQRLVHDAGVAAGAAEVGLVDDPQPAAERGRRRGEPRLVAHLPGALVGEDHLGDGREHQRVLADRGERRDAVGGPVERRHPDRHRGPAGRLDRGVPAALVQGQRVVVGGEVEPVPAAVLERPQVQRDVHVVHAVGVEHDAALVDPRAVGLGAVDVDAAAALQPQLEVDLGQRRPVPPVAGGEGVEVRPERHLALLQAGTPRSATSPAAAAR